jgi:hypothetical protein
MPKLKLTPSSPPLLPSNVNHPTAKQAFFMSFHAQRENIWITIQNTINHTFDRWCTVKVSRALVAHGLLTIFLDLGYHVKMLKPPHGQPVSEWYQDVFISWDHAAY